MTANPATQNRRILLIDDNESIHQDFRKILNPDSTGKAVLASASAALFGNTGSAAAGPCFEIDSAYQGEEGLASVHTAHAEGRPYAMAFVDVRMPPGWDGIETISRIWAEYPDLEVVVCTAYSDYTLSDIVGVLGETDRMLILKKPFDTIEVLQLARSLTKKWQLTQQARATIKTLETAATVRAAQLDESEERFRLIAENAADLITVLDPECRVVYRSPSFKKVLGFALDPWLDCPPDRQFHPDDRQKVIACKQEMIRTGIGQIIEYRIQHCDGSWRVFEAHGNPVCNAHGKVEHLVVVARDITERRLEEQKRQQMEIQLRHAQKMESIGQLAAGIAHEINTPTQYIGNNTAFARDGVRTLMKVLAAHGKLLQAARLGPVGPELIKEVDDAAPAADIEYLSVELPDALEHSLLGINRVAKIVGAMKEFSHPGSDEKTPADLNHAIESTLTVATNEWKYVANLVTDFDPDLPPVPCLPGELNQVILNLVVNSSHAIADVIAVSGGKGTITASTRRDGDWVEIRIADTGAGIPEEIRTKVFDPFFTTKGVGKGTGQGLAIAHSVVVDKHGGNIQLESEVGKGSTFIIRLPLSVDNSEAEMP
jgi:two-component system NtrC family sensor kinase